MNKYEPIPVEIKRLVIEDFKKNIGTSELAKKYNISIASIYNICRAMGLKTNRFLESLSHEAKLEICKKYSEDKIFGKDLAKEYNVNIKTIWKALREFNISKNKINVNESFFENLDTKESAYFSGLLAADGHLKHGSSLKNKTRDHTIVIGLKLTDINILEQFKKALNSDHQIYIGHKFDKRTNKTYDRCTLQICNTKLHTDLTKHGIGHDKSKNLIIPNTIPSNLLHYHFRGLVDGDGFWSISKNNNLSFGMVSPSYDFLFQFKSIIEKECNLHDTQIINDIENSGIYRLIYSGNLQCHKIADWIYQGDKYPCLERKYELVQNHLNWYAINYPDKYSKYLKKEKLNENKEISNPIIFGHKPIKNPKILSDLDRILGFGKTN